MLVISSAALGFLSRFDALANHTDQLGVETTVHAKGNAAEKTCEYEQTETPNPSDSSRHFFWEIISLTSAHRTQQSSSRDVALSGVITLVVGIETLVRIVALVVVALSVGRRRWRCYVRMNVRC